jgi:hypothetical protein
MSEFTARLADVERRATQNDENVRFILLELKKHGGLLEKHGGLLEQHGQTLDAHTRQFQLIRIELDGHREILDHHTQELGWLRRGMASLLNRFGLDLPADEEE